MKKKLDKVTLVKEIARERQGSPRQTQIEGGRRPTSDHGDSFCHWCYDEGCRYCVGEK